MSSENNNNNNNCQYVIQVDDSEISLTTNQNLNQNHENNIFLNTNDNNDNNNNNNKDNQTHHSINTASSNSTNYSDALSNKSFTEENFDLNSTLENKNSPRNQYNPEIEENSSSHYHESNHCYTALFVKNDQVMINIFQFLSASDINRCMLINRRWLYMGNHPRVWHNKNIFAPSHEEQFKFELLWFIIDNEVKRLIDSPTFETLDNTILVHYIYRAFSNFPLYAHKGEEFQQRIRIFFITIPKLLVDLKIATKKDIVTDFKELLLLLFDNLLRTSFRRMLNTYCGTENKTEPDDSDNDFDSDSDINSDNVNNFDYSNNNEINNNQVYNHHHHHHHIDNDDLKLEKNHNHRQESSEIQNDSFDIIEEGEYGKRKHIIPHKENEEEIHESQDTESLEYQRDVSERAAVATKLVQKIMVEIQQSGGLRTLSENIKACSTLEELPSRYQQLFDATRAITVDMLFTELCDDRAIRKLKTIHMLTPVLAIKGLLTLTNPIRLVNGMFSLFLARPFGSRSLIQRIMEVIVETNKTKTIVKEVQREFIQDSGIDKNEAKSIIQNISDYVDRLEFHILIDFTDNEDFGIENHSTEDKEAIMKKVLDSHSSPPSSSSSFVSSFFSTSISNKPAREYNSKQIQMMFNIYRSAIRLRQKKLVIDLLGSEEIITPLKQLAQVTLEPLMDIYAIGNIGSCISVLSNTVSEIIKAARCKDNQEKERLFTETLKRVEKELYRLFVHPIFVSKTNIMEELMFWVADLTDFLDRQHMNTKTLYDQLYENDAEKAFQLREALTKSWEQRLERGGVDATLPNGYAPDLGVDSHYVKSVLVPEFGEQVNHALENLNEQLKNRKNDNLFPENQDLK